MPVTLPATRAPMPHPNPSTEMTGSMMGATKLSFHRRRCTTTLRRQTASASRRLICVAANVMGLINHRGHNAAEPQSNALAPEEQNVYSYSDSQTNLSSVGA